jgi:hypothetical protein
VIERIREFAADNLAVVAFFGFFAFFGVLRAYQDLGYKETLPIIFVGDFTPAEKVDLRLAVGYHLKTWQADFNRNSRWSKIRIVRDIPGTLLGQCGGDEILLEAGRFNELPAFYHELCHLNYGDVGRGGDHSAAGWIYWNQRCRVVALTIAQQKYKATLDDIPAIIPYEVQTVVLENCTLTAVIPVVK